MRRADNSPKLIPTSRRYREPASNTGADRCCPRTVIAGTQALRSGASGRRTKLSPRAPPPPPPPPPYLRRVAHSVAADPGGRRRLSRGLLPREDLDELSWPLPDTPAMRRFRIRARRASTPQSTGHGRCRRALPVDGSRGRIFPGRPASFDGNRLAARNDHLSAIFAGVSSGRPTPPGGALPDDDGRGGARVTTVGEPVPPGTCLRDHGGTRDRPLSGHAAKETGAPRLLGGVSTLVGRQDDDLAWVEIELA